MLQDTQGLQVSTDSPEAIAAINHFIDQSLSYGNEALAAIQTSIMADPTCALAHAYAAAYYLSQENAADRQAAVPHLQIAQQYAATATKREQLYIAAIAAWQEQAIEQALAIQEAITAEFPLDLIAVQQGQYHCFYLGDQQRLLQIAQQALPANQDNHYLCGMVAFALEQCHLLKEAEAFGRRAIALNRNDPWAQHAVAHVMETQGRAEEGIAWMEGFADTWEDCNSMLYTHNWWHVALYYLKRGNTEKALEIYDTRVWGRARQETPKDQVGAIALLLRLELSGVAVGDRWQVLSYYLLPRIHEHALPFQDLHYIYALARAGKVKCVAQMLQSMQEHAQTVSLYQRQHWLEVAIPAAKGLIAHAVGDWSTASAALKPVLHQLQKIGGSHAQRALFQQIYQNAFLHAAQGELTVR